VPGVEKTVALGEGDGVSVGGSVGDGDGDADTLGEGVGLGFAFFFVVGFFRCGRGVGEGPVKSLLIFCPHESCSSGAVHAWLTTPIVTAITITSKGRSLVLTRDSC
jgi:hypothetical protein